MILTQCNFLLSMIPVVLTSQAAVVALQTVVCLRLEPGGNVIMKLCLMELH